MKENIACFEKEKEPLRTMILKWDKDNNVLKENTFCAIMENESLKQKVLSLKKENEVLKNQVLYLQKYNNILQEQIFFILFKRRKIF